jgi:hypothetical protein
MKRAAVRRPETADLEEKATGPALRESADAAQAESIEIDDG